MKIDDTDLLAYLDNELPQEKRVEVEAELAASPDLRERLAAMAKSVLPYAAAFDRQSIPRLPAGLQQQIAQLARGSADPVPAARSVSCGRSLRIAAVAFFVGALLSGGVLKYWPHATSSAEAAAWMQPVAVYQALYARQTLIHINEDPALTAKIVSESEQAGVPVRIPDLHGSGLTFKRVQQLRFHDRPVVQIVYLPERGDPVALCVTHEPRKAEAPHLQEFGDMRAAVWHDGSFGYMLVAKNTSVDLLTIGRQIARGATQSLYGRNSRAG